MQRRIRGTASAILMNFQLKILMPSDPRFLPVVRATVGELSVACGLQSEGCNGVTLAVDEALANIIRHAYKSQHDCKIEMHCEAESGQMEFRLLDWGEPPDPARICGQPLNDSSLSGRGTHLIKAIMDEVVYERVEGANQIRLIKRLPDREGNTEGESSVPS
jgi:anti-sigma regulatory factor (Ser/Thr protein kinase)